MTTAAPNPFKIFPLFQLSVISYQLSVGQLSVISGKWQVASGEVGKWGDHFVRVAGGSGAFG
ncbi:MAG: hypothetical protein ACKPHT_12715 [Microcystis panniformis]